MQAGGSMPKQQDYPDYESWQAAMDAWMAQNSPQLPTIDMSKFLQQDFNQQDLTGPTDSTGQMGERYDNRLQESIARGVIEPKQGWNSAQEQYDFIHSPSQQPQKPAAKNPYQTLQDIGLGVQGVRTGLGWLSGMVERGRQNKYDMEQQTALGMMNPMQASDFQPNPYNLYMMQGGKLKTIAKDYDKWSNDAGPMDMTHSNGNPQMKKGGYEIDRMIIVRKLLPELLKLGRLGSARYRNYKNGGINKK